MNNKSSLFHHIRLRYVGLRLMQTAALAIMIALAMPARAEGRAIKSRFPAVYPEIAKRMRVCGVVRLAVTVDAEGKVIEVKPLSGNTLLSTAATEAVRKWRFEPGSESTEEIALNFNLQ